MNVHTLITIPEPDQYDACTLCFSSLRIGFPTAHITAWLNYNMTHRDVREKARLHLEQLEREKVLNQVIVTPHTHHADWISERVYCNGSSGPLVIIDSDTIFWESCEHFEKAMAPGTLLSGYFVPRIWNEWAQCISQSRIHTSFMWFPNVPALIQRIEQAYPQAFQHRGDYCPCDPWHPDVKFNYGRPVFWDTCSNLFHMLGANKCRAFDAHELSCFDHLNCASFYSQMVERMENPSGMIVAHKQWVRNPKAFLKNLWPIVNKYYDEMAARAQLIDNGLTTMLTAQ